jgi:hypothetical protein
VSAALMADWRLWLAPNVQPFFVSTSFADVPATAEHGLTPELRDTYQAYKLPRELRTIWLDEEAFSSLPQRTRARLVRGQADCGRASVPTVRAWSDLIDPETLRAQADGHRFVWWPSLLSADVTDRILERAVSDRRLPSRHNEVSEMTWMRCAHILPRARTLAGTFPSGSGPNCFSTVMAACDDGDARRAWGSLEPFEEWLEEKTRPGGEDDSPGTILLWRKAGGLAQHAAVTIGDGWVIEKPSQDWHSPRAVLPVREMIKANRHPGERLQRRKHLTAMPTGH